MSTQFPISDDDSNDDLILDSCSETGTALLEPNSRVNAATEKWDGARCEKCDARLVSDIVSICRHCGWYASLGQFVEVDPDWEIAAEPEQATAPVPRPSHVQVWLRMMPRWAWIAIGCVLTLIAESIVARFVTPADSWARTTWSLSQLAIGVVVACSCHTFNFLALTEDDSELGILDLMLKPIKLWTRAFSKLPTRQWVVNGAINGLTAALLSVLVIGGIPYDRLWDWGVKQPPKQDLMGAVMEQVQKVEGNEDDLEKSINDFAGKAGEESSDKPKDPPKPKHTADCVILGFQLDRDGAVASLVLGTASSGQLVYAGSVSPKLSDSDSKALAKALQSIVTDRPLLRVEISATWVKPNYACRVNFGERSQSGRLRDIEWDTMLGNIQSRSRSK